ncbi:MAG: hypothetical protein QW767_06820 [Thermoprotei archaeon]
MAADAFRTRLAGACELFCSFKPNLNVREAVLSALSFDRVVITFDYGSRVYAEFASWPLIAAGYSVTLANTHTAQYFLAPYADPGTCFFNFSSDPYSVQQVQLASAIRVMGYSSVSLTSFDASRVDASSRLYGTVPESVHLTSGDGAVSLMSGIKNVCYAFTSAAVSKRGLPRLSRVSETLLVEKDVLFEYLSKATESLEDKSSPLLGAEGPFLSAAKCVSFLKSDFKTVSLSKLAYSPPKQQAEIWSSDIDNELVARIRFQTPSQTKLNVVHFGFDPLSAALVLPYAVVKAGAEIPFREHFTPR